MSDLPTPITRKEQFLNSIARGNTSGLPTPITREEEYLDAIAKSGGGGGEGDMKKSVYDSDLTVANAGGIKAFVSDAVSGKVDKVAGKGLSTNDYDNTEKGKVVDNTSAIEAIVNVTGSCNVLPFPYTDSSKTDVDVQWTVNSDGTVRATGSNNHSSWRVFTFTNTSMKKVFPCAGEYMIKCYGAQSGTYNFDFAVYNGSNPVINENVPDSGKKYTITEEMLDYTCNIKISIKNNISSSIDVTFKPMIHDARLHPSDYVPYAMTNRELTKTVEPLTSRVRNNITNKLSNLLIAVSEQNLEKYGYKIGDYFTGASGYTYYLADMDTFYGGYWLRSVVAIHHVGVVVDTHAWSKWMNGTVTTYGESTLHAFLTGTALNNIKSDMIALFGGSTGLEHLAGHYKLFAGVGTWDWTSSAEYISALTEVQIYGCPIWSGDRCQQGEADKKLKLFDKYRFNELFGNQWHWLRSLLDSSEACYASADGGAGSITVGADGGVSGLILLH